MGNGGAAVARDDCQSQDIQAASKKLIVALDVPSVGEARKIVLALDGIVDFFKIGLHLQMLRGTEEFINELLQKDKRVFIDYKYGDIPESVKWGVTASAERGIDFLTIQGNGDITREVLRAAVQGKKEGRPKLFLVTLFTYLSEYDLVELGTSRTVEEIVRNRVEMALETGLDGVVASGQEVNLIRKMAPSEKLLIVAPGIRPTGASVDDHKRVATPRQAIFDGSDYLVVGRLIVKFADRRGAARAIVDEIAGAIADS